MSNTVLEIPIYRCSKEKHSSEQVRQKEKLIEFIYGSKDFEVDDQFINEVFYSDKWYSWNYNDIVGWLEINYFKGELQTEVWKVDKKRIYPGIRKKKFIYDYRLCKTRLYPDQQSENIFASLLFDIEFNLSHDKQLQKRFIDFKKFKLVGGNLNWKKIISELI